MLQNSTKLITYSKLWGSALDMLSRREYCEKELTSKLGRKFAGHKVSVANNVAQLGAADNPPIDFDEALLQVLAQLKDQGLLDDKRFTQSLIRSRVNRGYGPYYIRQELRQKGVGASLAEQELDDYGVDWHNIAEQICLRRYPQAQASKQEWGRAARFLQRRGFSSEVVTAAAGAIPRD